MTTRRRLEEAETRRDDIQRELQNIADNKGASTNPTLGELETVMMKELEFVEKKIQQISDYLGKQDD